MRDPARIPVILARLQAAWERSPDLRLTQLVVAVVRPKASCPEVFHCEDDRFLALLDEFDSRH